MKSILVGVLVGTVLLLMISSCATVPTEPLGQGEVRLLSVDFPERIDIKQKSRCVVNIEFEARDNPQITRVYAEWAGAGSHYINKMEVSYENRLIRVVDVPTPEKRGSYGFKVYVYYVRDGRIQQTNVVETSVSVTEEKSHKKIR